MPQPVDRPDSWDFLVVQAGVRRLGVVWFADFGRKDDRAPVGRPDRIPGAVPHPGQLSRLTAMRREHPDLGLPDTAIPLLPVLWLELACRAADDRESPAVR